MLILTRRTGESLMVGDDVVVTVLGVKGNQVRIGVSAPEDVAQVVFRAATDPKRKPHYEINNMMSMKIANLLPKLWVDKLLLRAFS